MVKINNATSSEIHELLYTVERYIKGSITDICVFNKAEIVVENISRLEKLRKAIILDNIGNDEGAV